MEIREKVNYWALVTYVTTLTGRPLSVANVLKLRCNILQWGDKVPLSIKVYWNRRDHGDKVPAEGDTILVQAYRKFHHQAIHFKPITSRTGKDSTMAMSKDRVRFYIGDRYTAMPSAKIKIGKVMARAFGISAMAADSWLNGGLWVTCRPSQFARFLIYRNEAGITNGFMDLRAELVKVPKDDIYDVLAKQTGMVRADVKKVALALNFDKRDVENALGDRAVSELDVSKNPKFV